MCESKIKTKIVIIYFLEPKNWFFINHFVERRKYINLNYWSKGMEELGVISPHRFQLDITKAWN
jgi:predicted patatin/cPLA2 family phospholipase